MAASVPPSTATECPTKRAGDLTMQLPWTTPDFGDLRESGYELYACDNPEMTWAARG